MSNKPDGGPAFPVTANHMVDGLWQSCDEGGMTLRDYFAGQALQGLASSGWAENEVDATVAAANAYRLADAMIAERSK